MLWSLALVLLVASCRSTDDSAAEAPTTTPTETPTVESETIEATPPVESEVAPADGFSEDFVAADSKDRFEYGIHHRDDDLVTTTEWPGDHPITGPDDLCGPPEEKRVVTRGERGTGFNEEWIYRCVPGGDTAAAHLMTSIGDTSGYSIGAFSPSNSFEGVTEVSWALNITDLGTRQFTEVKLVPVEDFDFQNLPCAIEWLPCDTDHHVDLGSVGTSFFNHEMLIHAGTAATKDDVAWGSEWLNPGDPALTDLRERRTHVFRDNGDGTLSFGIEQPDGTFHTISGPGSFPTGPVRVVFADHNYTPTKEHPDVTFTWHWDDIEIATAVGAKAGS